MYAEVRASADPRQAHAHWRTARDELFAGHPQSPLSGERRAAFTGLPVAAYDPSFRFVCTLEPAEHDHRDVPTGTDGVVAFDRVGRVALGDLGALDVWSINGYGGGLFVPLRDSTAGATSYGGGRYVIDTRKGADLGGDAADGALVVDLNFAYHPSCAYDPAWACPLAPPGNVLSVPANVGEQLPPGGWY
ncbi:MAG: DUF1684 domain-containing protein [Actinomycetes bacterium]